MDPILKKLLSGDIGLSASNALISKVIRFGGKLHTGKADRSHALASIGDLQVIEALVRVRINDIEKYADQDIEFWRIPITLKERAMFRRGMLLAAGDSYGWGKPVLAGFDSIATGLKKLFTLNRCKDPVFFFSRTFGFLSFKDCSQLIGWGLEKYTSYRIKDTDGKNVPWKKLTPDYLQDLMNLAHNEAKLIYKAKTPA